MMNIIIFLAFFVSGVKSYCNNDCNGHGTCGQNDKCTCFKTRSGELAWIGNLLNSKIIYMPINYTTYVRSRLWIADMSKVNIFLNIY